MLITQRLKQPTRRRGWAILKCLPIWSCSGRGLPCPRCRHRGGGLLPRRFTLTPMLPSRRFVFCGPIPRILSRSPLATSLPCGVRTFLYPDIYIGGSGHLIPLQRAIISIAGFASLSASIFSSLFI